MRRSAFDLRIDCRERGDRCRSPNSVCRACVDRDAARRRCGGMELVRLDVPRRGELAWRDAAGPELSEDAAVAGERIRAAARGQVAPGRNRIGGADECDADSGGCETFREQQHRRDRSYRLRDAAARFDRSSSAPAQQDQGLS